jgi:uncharacterized protein YhfF
MNKKCKQFGNEKHTAEQTAQEIMEGCGAAAAAAALEEQRDMKICKVPEWCTILRECVF